MPHSNGCDAGTCQACGRQTRRSVGVWCYSCYLQIAGLDRTEKRYTDPDRERRIALYRSRAEQGKPILED